jgi:hypothetical protein
LIFKIALIATYLGFFATQLSYKYYYHSSLPCYSRSGLPASDHQKLGSMMPGAKGIFVLSLDKRFDGKQLYAYPAPVIRVEPPLRGYVDDAAGRPEDILHSRHITATQRGPPLRA